MSLKDLKAAASVKLVASQQEIMNYISALEARVKTHELTLYAIGAAVIVVMLLIAVHHFKH